MKTAVVLQHLEFENAGLIGNVLAKRGYELKNLDATRDDISAFPVNEADIVIILGGPIGVYDGEHYPFITQELKLIEKSLKIKKPMIGVCLGAQLIASVLGAKVQPMGKKEISFSSLQLTDEGEKSPLALISTTPVLHWHGDQFEIPEGAKRLAETGICPNQAFSYENILALQFHLEADLDYFEHWLVGHAVELSQAGIDPVNLRHAAKKHQNDLRTKAEKIFNLWCEEAL
ncbi:GMP synthase (glutamine-hydrolysing) [Bartonella apis]|uniref:glutamine amidotransferase n=1 Tax=Bartonella apis TaxID=1686310 RepID=UPI0009621513|nr:glutamine amidotransferase [Bartonella apis]OLY46247.1 GMP synthase (glutamine-hydrolysing) [Bartonella apis]